MVQGRDVKGRLRHPPLQDEELPDGKDLNAFEKLENEQVALVA
jgi:hypothetical protein